VTVLSKRSTQQLEAILKAADQQEFLISINQPNLRLSEQIADSLAAFLQENGNH